MLVNRNSGKVVDVFNFATNDGARIAQWTRGDGDWQQWQFVDSGGGYYRLRSRHSGKVLDDYQWSTAENAQIVQWTDLNGANQQFRLVGSDSGYVRLINRHSNKALSVQGASTANGTNIVQTTDTNGAHQQWQLVRLGGTTPPSGGTLPTTIRWSSSGVLAGPKPDSAHPDIAAIKDYTVVRHNGAWQVYATRPVLRRAGTWCISRSRIGRRRTRATHTYLDSDADRARLPGGAAHLLLRAAGPVVHGLPDRGAYLLDQHRSGQPTLVDDAAELHEQRACDRDAEQGRWAWLDFWMICDSSNCYLFSSDDNGHIYRSQTTLANFPNGFGNTVIALQDSRFALFEGSAVYKVAGVNQYLLLQEAIGSDGRRWYRSFTSNSAERNVDAASGDRVESVRAVEQRHVQRRRVDAGLQPWGVDPGGQRSDGAAEPVPTAVPVSGAGPERERRLHPPALADGPAHAEQFDLLAR